MLITENYVYIQALRDYDLQCGIKRPTRAYWYERKLSALYPWGRVSDHTKDQLKTIGYAPITALVVPVGATSTAANAFIRINRLDAHVRYTNIQTILDVYFGNVEDYDELSGSTKMNLSDLANNITVIKAGEETPNKLTVEILNSYLESVRMSPTPAHVILCYEGDLASFIHTYMEDQSQSPLKVDQIVNLNPQKDLFSKKDIEIIIPENVAISYEELEKLKKDYSNDKLARNLVRYSEWKVDKEIRSDFACFKHFLKQEKQLGESNELGKYIYKHTDLGWVKMMEYSTPIFEALTKEEVEKLSACDLNDEIPMDQLFNDGSKKKEKKKPKKQAESAIHPWELL